MPTPAATSLQASTVAFRDARYRRVLGPIAGEEPEMWWYTVRFEAPAPIRQLSLRNGVLFDLFDDQRNMTKVLHVASEKEFAYYFVEDDAKPQTMRF